jgi:CRISPR-associated protein Cmr2
MSSSFPLSHKEQIFELKIAALLHDPPHKPWLENHEETAKRWIGELLGKGGQAQIPDEVRRADRLASSIDRYLLSILMGDKYIPGFLATSEIKLKNTINPLFEIDLKQWDKTEADKFFEELNGILKNLNLKDKYLALYSIYELLWIDKNLPVGPADTRVPTHTVFDHAYATATALNWITKDGYDGYLVGFDIPGVQEYIASSRKLRDAAISSYIISAFAWNIMLPFIEELGPDVVVIPSLRSSPFFLHWVSTRLHGEVQTKIKQLMEKYVLISKDLRDLYRVLNMPPFASFPEKAVLVLPVEKVESCNIEQILHERLAEAWRRLWRTAEKLSEARAKEKDASLVWKFINKVFKYYVKEFSNSGFDKVPPVTLRVQLVRINGQKALWQIYDNAYRELSRKFNDLKNVRVDARVKLNLFNLTKNAFKEGLGYPKKSRKAFDYCTVCGTLPAIIILPSGEDEDGKDFAFFIFKAVEEDSDPTEAESLWHERSQEEIEKFEKWFKDNTAELETFKAVFTPGERLCPWCFLKRVVSMEPRLLRILLEERDPESLVNELISQETPGIKIPSTSDIATYKLKEELINTVILKPEKETLLKDLTEVLSTSLGTQLAQQGSGNLIGLSLLWTAQRRLEEKIAGKLRDEETLPLRLVVRLDPETYWLGRETDIKKEWLRLFKQLDLEKWLWSYYSLIIADGDSISSLHDGRVSAFFGTSWDNRNVRNDVRVLKKKIIESSAIGTFSELIKDAIEALESLASDTFIEKWSKILEQHYPAGMLNSQQVAQRLNNFLQTLENILNDEDKLPLTLTYHTALSAALVRASLLDAATILELGGFVVYAGGDDLLAFSPVHKAVEIAICTRSHFAGSCKRGKHSFSNVRLENSFLMVNNACLPMLPGVGRSYNINTAHYLYPLQLVISEARERLKDAKEKIVSSYWEPSLAVILNVHKDLAAFTYSPRGGGSTTYVPITLGRIGYIDTHRYFEYLAEPLEVVQRVIERIEPLSLGKPQFTVSLLYDIEEFKDLLTSTITKLGSKFILSQRLILRIIERNTYAKPQYAQQLYNSILGEMSELISHAKVINTNPKEKNEKEIHLFVSLIRGVRNIRGGMRT